MLRKNIELIILLLVLSYVSFAKMTTTQKEDKPIVVLVSFDGFRHDYVEKFDAPNFKTFIDEGVAAQGLIPSFPSKTFPNHYSIVTGLYPSHHGLVDNSFYDRDLGLTYTIGNRKVVEDARFYGGTPLWQLVQEHGMKSASYFWVGSEAPVKGRFPDYYHIYDGAIANETRIEAAMEWLKLPAEQRPQFITLYFSLVDSEGHRAGPNAESTKRSVLEADRLLGLLMKGIEDLPLDINVLLVSDHGMHEIPPSPDNYISIEQLQTGLNRSDYKFVSNGAHAHFYVNEQKNIKKIYRELKKREEGYQTFLRKDFPKKWHYQGNASRIGDIIVTMNTEHYLSSSSRIEGIVETRSIKGEHGFDPYEMQDMQGIFYANGPQLKEGLRLSTFENVHIYPLIAKLLGITELPEIDGKLEVLQEVIK